MGQPKQQQEPPGIQSEMDPVPDSGETQLPRLRQADRQGGGDHRRRQRHRPGRRHRVRAGRRRRADRLPDEDDDAAEVAKLVEEAGRKAVLVRGDLSEPQHCRDVIARAVDEFGRIDVLVSNAAYQMTHESLEEIPDDEWGYTFRTNVEAMFHLVKAAVPHMPPGSSIIGSSSVNSDMPSPTLAPYAATKAAIANFTASLAQLLGEKGIRVNSVAPGPIWTPLIPSTMPPEKVENFG